MTSAKRKDDQDQIPIVNFEVSRIEVIKRKINKDYVLFKINCNGVLKNVMIERNNIAIKFLKKQGCQLYRIQSDIDFSFAYHPYNSSSAPEIGYIIKDDKTLRKIFHIGSSKPNQDMPTIVLHIVFADQYPIYEDK